MLRVQRLLRALLTVITLMALAGWGLYRDESSATDLEKPMALGRSLRETWIVDVDPSATFESFLCLVRGELYGNSPVWLHCPDDPGPGRSVPLDDEQIFKIAMFPDSLSAVVFGEAGNVQRIDLASNARTNLQRIPSGKALGDLAVSPDGQFVAIATESDIILCDSRNGAAHARFSIPATIVVRVSFSQDCRFLVAGRTDGTVCLWNLKTGGLERIVPVHEGPVSMVQFVADNERVASIGQMDDALCITNLATGENQWQSSAHQQGLLALAVSPDGRFAATGGFSHSVELWDLEERVRVRTLAGHTGAIRALRFNSDGTQLMTAADGTICLWDVETATIIWAVDVQQAVR